MLWDWWQWTRLDRAKLITNTINFAKGPPVLVDERTGHPWTLERTGRWMTAVKGPKESQRWTNPLPSSFALGITPPGQEQGAPDPRRGPRNPRRATVPHRLTLDFTLADGLPHQSHPRLSCYEIDGCSSWRCLRMDWLGAPCSWPGGWGLWT